MSRVGRSPSPVPAGVAVTIDDAVVTVNGPKGQLTQAIPPSITVRLTSQDHSDGADESRAEGAPNSTAVLVERANDDRIERSLHGLTRSLINNMCVGVSEGFTKELNIVGVGYRAVPKGPTALELSLGFSHTVTVNAPEGITFDAPNPTTINVVGFDKQLVGQVAANIRALRKPEPYKGKGIRYADERVIRKAGKAAK